MKQYASSIKKVCILELTVSDTYIVLYSVMCSCFYTFYPEYPPDVKPKSCLLSALQGKEIIEYYLRELEEEGVTSIPRWTSRHHLLPPSTARAIPVKAAKNGLDSKNPICPTELVVGTPEGQCLLTSRNC